MMHRILCSTGAVLGRPNGRDITLLREAVQKLHCDGYELMMYDTWYDKIPWMRECLQTLDVSIPVFHVEKSVGNLISRNGEHDTEQAVLMFETNCILAKEFGAEMLVLHLWGGLDSDKDIAHNIRTYAKLRELADAHGLVLTVENVVCNQQDPMTHLHELASAYPDIRFTFDTKMAAFHGQMDALYAKENRALLSHMHHMHINDYGGGYKDWSNLNTLHIGDGHVDFDKLFAFLKEIGYRGDFTVEATSFDQTGAIDFDALNRTFDKIRTYLGD
ncbi:MAG: sugar phosphate isomerase/epimerase [Clostridia bacterium]|nr:sugar phosphate isomerase/epimerase [Clostridia bacterium]